MSHRGSDPRPRAASGQSPARADGGLRSQIVEQADALAPFLAAWDELAVRAGRPFCAPGWMLAWWREGRSGDARLRVVLVFDGEELVGVGPFFAQVGVLGLVEMRLLGAGFCHRIGPLAAADREPAVAHALAGALAQMRPTPASVVFEGVDLEDDWPARIAAEWPGRRPRLRLDVRMEGSVIELGGSLDEWMQRRPRQFRKEARRTARRLQEEHVAPRVAGDAQDVETLVRLHEARWAPRGGTGLGGETEAVLLDAARELGASGRMQVALLDGPDGPIAAELILGAGDVAAFWGGGFDPAWSRHAPGTQAMLAALQSMADDGVRVADIGGGHLEYQRKMADHTQPVVWQTLFPRGARYPLIRLRLAPKHARLAMRGLARRLPSRQHDLLRRALRRRA